MLKNFKISTERDELAPDLQCYQMGLGPLVDNLAARGLVEEDFKLLPSWNKFVSDPRRHKGFFVNVLKAVFGGELGHDELSIDHQIGTVPKKRVAMMFLPDGTRNVNSEMIENLAREALPPGFEVLVLSGALRYRGKRITNRNAEKIVSDVVRNHDRVLIITSKLAQRSFSIPELTEVYLAYDGGDIGATTQKTSRPLTPGDKNKVAKVISLSFDPNRDDKFDAMILETADNIDKRLGLNNMKEAMRIVLSTMDIFSCQPEGALKIQVDDYLMHAMARKGFSRAIGSKLDMSLLDKDTIDALATGKSDYLRAAIVQATPMGKTHDVVVIDPGTPVPRDPKNLLDKNEARNLAKAREVILTILENIDVILFASEENSIYEAMKTVENSPVLSASVERVFEVPIEFISQLLKRGVINQRHVDIVHNIL